MILLPRPLAAAAGIRRPCNYIDAVSRTNTASSRSSNLFCGRYQRFHHGRAGLFLFKSFSKCFSRYFLRKKVSWEAILASTLSYWMFYESFAQYFKSSTLDGAAPFTGFRYFHFIFSPQAHTNILLLFETKESLVLSRIGALHRSPDFGRDRYFGNRL